jgi:hypothetical protein
MYDTMGQAKLSQNGSEWIWSPVPAQTLSFLYIDNAEPSTTAKAPTNIEFKNQNRKGWIRLSK